MKRGAGSGGIDLGVQGRWWRFVPPINLTLAYPKARRGNYLTNVTIDFIEEKRGEFFLAVCAHLAAHVPL